MWIVGDRVQSIRRYFVAISQQLFWTKVLAMLRVVMAFERGQSITKYSIVCSFSVRT
jgi:hypothetical protein